MFAEQALFGEHIQLYELYYLSYVVISNIDAYTCLSECVYIKCTGLMRYLEDDVCFLLCIINIPTSYISDNFYLFISCSRTSKSLLEGIYLTI